MSGEYFGVDGMEIRFTDLLFENNVAKRYIVDGTSFGEYKGYSEGTPSSSSIAYVKYEPIVLKSNAQYYLWFGRNKVTIAYNTNGGTLASHLPELTMAEKWR